MTMLTNRLLQHRLNAQDDCTLTNEEELGAFDCGVINCFEAMRMFDKATDYENAIATNERPTPGTKALHRPKEN
jgi:hypothetical protein